MELPKSQLLPGKTIQICGSKSISNRVLILNALFHNIKAENLSDSEDTTLLQKALSSSDHIHDIHHSGTAMRFLTAYFAVCEGKEVILTGSARMKERPIEPLVNALRDLGAEIEYLDREGYPPLKITGKKIRKSKVEIEAGISSQFITALMLIGATLENGLQIVLKGKITSKSYLQLTLKLLRTVGIEADFEQEAIRIQPFSADTKSSNIFHFEIESDWSSASYFYSLAALGKQPISIRNFKTYSDQGDSRLKSIYWENFGVNTVSDSQANEITLSHEISTLPQKIRLNLNDCPDLAQTICVTAASLQIPFHLEGLETLKIKETDRLSAMQNELFKIGCMTEITEHSIQSSQYFKPSAEIRIKTYNDHRMAMSFAPYALLNSLEIENPEVVKKSYPKFWRDFQYVTAKCRS